MSSTPVRTFKPGFIFKKAALTLEPPVGTVRGSSRRVELGKAFWKFRQADEEASLRGGPLTPRRKRLNVKLPPISRWERFKTPLRKYAGFSGINVERVLRAKLDEAKKEGRTVRVLDVGIGSGKQWLPWLRRYGKTLDLRGSSLSHTFHPTLAGRVRVVDGAHLHEKFPRSSFDFIVCMPGAYGQDLSALENIHWLLKKGGEAVVHFSYPQALDDTHAPLWSLNPKIKPAFFQLLYPLFERDVGIVHIRKFLPSRTPK